jgi:hypothetical protein
MSIVNRRNAMLGWAAWTAAKQVAAHKARAAVHVDEGKTRKRLRLIIPLLAAAAAVLFFWRHKSDDEVPPPGE